MFQKQTILQIKNVYTANAFQTSTGFYIGAGSETEPVVQLYNLASGIAEKVDNCPGGLMSFIPVPGQAGMYVTIMGLFPPFIGKEAGLYLHRETDSGWNTVKAMDLPFAHRCEFIKHKQEHYLVAATVSKWKANPADWSRPGELHLITMGDHLKSPWKSVIIDSGITRNHGMTRTTIGGMETICISGEQGIFYIVPGENDQWVVKSLFDKEVSEMTFIDLDGDGSNEMVTIEPFHGNTLNIYKRKENNWELKFSHALSFGHGLSSGMFNGIPVIVAGNRRDSFSLEIFTVDNLSKGAVKMQVIDENAGPTQTQVFSYNSVDYILSANQRKNEVTLYTGPQGKSFWKE